MPAVPQPALTAVATQRIAVITAASGALLTTAVDVQTNTLNKRLVIPASGQQTGGPGGTSGVLGDSIKVVPLPITNSTNNVLTFAAAVVWTEWIIPV